MALISSDGSISGGGGGSTTQSGTGATSNSNNITDTTDGSEEQFNTGYSGNAVIADDGSLIATPGEDITQVGNEVNAGPGQITGAATVEEAKQAVREAGGDPSKVQNLVGDPSADSDGTVLDLESKVESSVSDALTETSIANAVGSVTRDRESPLGDNNEPESDFNPTETVVGDGDGGSDYSITGTVDEDVSDADNTGAQTVPFVPASAGDGAGGSSVLDIVGAGGIVALIGVVGYFMSQE
jgi:hypothetical protein